MTKERFAKDYFEEGIFQTVSGTGPVHSQTVNQKTFAWRKDIASGTVTYYGWAAVGTLDAATTWRILRRTISGTVRLYEWADGDSNFDNQWSDRAALSYS